MVKVFDVEAYIPPDEQGNSRLFKESILPMGCMAPERLPQRPGYGAANYNTVFKRRQIPISNPTNTQSPKVGGKSIEAWVEELDKAGIVKAVIADAPHEVLAEVVARHKARFVALASVNPYDGMVGVRELERSVKELGLHGLLVQPLTSGLPASDAKYYPMYAKCVELGIPVRIYATMNYANDRPYDLGHPRHLDQIAVDFPELKILAGLGGWPWINDMVGLLRRHPNLYVDTAAHRPKHLATPGSGWEMMMQNVNTLIQDRFLVALAPGFFGLTYEEVIQEYLSLPLKSSVIDKIMYDNAAEFFGVETK